MLEAVKIHKSQKVLIDGRKLIGKPETIERFYYGEFAAQSVAEFGELGCLSCHTIRLHPQRTGT
jgi:hypothetical protein